MAGGKETPRQKMIGMMYLVLLAMLAMNVSKSILQSFVIINDGLEVTNENFAAKNDIVYAQFEKAKADNPEKVGQYHAQAMRVKELSNELEEYIEDLKKHLILMIEYGGDENAITDDSLYNLKNVTNLGDYDKPTTIMIGPEVTSPKEGEFTAMELKANIDKFVDEISEIVGDEQQAAAIAASLNTDQTFKEGDQTVSWAVGNFYHLALAAVVTNLTKIQADVRNAEADAIKILYKNIDAADFKFDTLAAKVIPRSTYVIQGDSFVADVIVAAFSTTQDPRMGLTTQFDPETGKPVYEGDFGSLDTSSVTIKDGAARYAVPANAEGQKEWGGIIEIKGPDGTWRPFDIPKQSYTVAKPTLVVSPTKMNVFYRGLQNPISVSVPGVPTDKLEVTVSNASKSGSNGNFEVKPGNGNTAVVSVSAELNGKKQSFGKQEFRVKNVPDPKPYFGGKTGSSGIKRAELLAAAGVIPQMENFEFDLKFIVQSYSVSAVIRGKLAEADCRGAALSGDAKAIIRELKSGQKVYIEKIKAKGPDGTVRDLGTIALTVI